MAHEKHFALLGHKARDVVTGFTGVVTSICFDLYGCVQAALTPFADKDGKTGDTNWFDTKRLEQMSDEPLMSVPTFDEVPGPSSEKPALPLRRF